MANDPGYFAFLLRLWRDNKAESSNWRASLENPHTGEQKGFASLRDLIAYLLTITKSRHPVDRYKEL